MTATRRLAAILAADVAGYSRLMELIELIEDEICDTEAEAEAVWCAVWVG